MGFFICLVALIASNVFWVYRLFDLSVSYSYMGASYAEAVKAKEALGNLVVLGSSDYSKKDFLHLLRQAYPDEFIVEKNSDIVIWPVQFTFENDRLVKVQ